MPKRKRTFPCGHKGYGRKCHRCEQEQMLQQRVDEEIAEKREKKLEWEASFDCDLIDLKGLPDYVVVKACLLYTSQSPRDVNRSRMPSSA